MDKVDDNLPRVRIVSEIGKMLLIVVEIKAIADFQANPFSHARGSFGVQEPLDLQKLFSRPRLIDIAADRHSCPVWVRESPQRDLPLVQGRIPAPRRCREGGRGVHMLPHYFYVDVLVGDLPDRLCWARECTPSIAQ